MRTLEEHEESAVKALTNYSIPLTLIEPTSTGLGKSIMDATMSVRTYLKEEGIHDYSTQQAGPEHKIVNDNTFLITEGNMIESRTSMYRPRAKQNGGDPRIWFKGLPGYVNPNDIIAITYLDNSFYIINITQLPVEQLLESSIITPLKELAEEFLRKNNSVADELLGLIQEIANAGPLKAIKSGDTAIGHALESALGIEENSSKQPDYKGIELKSYRAKKRASQESRKNLFAQVPNWDISKFKSSREILDNFGYQREEDFKLYCTVSTQVVNSQGLMLRLDSNTEQLAENSSDREIGDFVVWLMSDLKNRLLEKHNETFWIGADTSEIGGIEHFQYKKILHTRKPLPSAFELLVEQGQITVDHLIKRNSRGRVSEKGPLFKINGSALGMLFPQQVEYSLV